MQTFYELDTWDWNILLREVNEEWVKQADYVIPLCYVVENLENAWSFYSTIGRAMVYADMYNLNKLVKTFDNRIKQAALEVDKTKWEELI